SLRCKCASKKPKQTQTCGEKCEEADQYPCGGPADTNIFSFYTVENDRDAQDHWTGILKTESIISLDDMLDDSTYPPVTYAYLEQINKKFYVRYMHKACLNNATTVKSSGQPSAGVSTDVDNQQRVEYVNTANNDMHRNTENNPEAITYEKLNMTKGVDNYLSLQEINAVEHDYQNT
ncbi:hypothetical protein MAR_014411, partial [Mya arenaria]